MSSVRTATVTPAGRLEGHLRVPGDKSFSHRYALMAALPRGRSELRNYAPSADCRSTLTCLAAPREDASVTVTLMGRGRRSFRSPGCPRDTENSGTTTRMMTGVPAGLTISVRGGQTRIARSLTTPSDLRSAAFWMAAAAAMPGSTVTRGDVGRNLTRTAPIGVLRKRGPNVDLRETANAAGESIGTIIVTGDRTGSIHIQPHEVPEPIDELPDIASLGAYSGEVRMEAGGFLETLDRLVA